MKMLEEADKAIEILKNTGTFFCNDRRHRKDA